MRPLRVEAALVGVAGLAALAVHVPLLFGHGHGARGGGGGCPFGYGDTPAATAGAFVHDPQLRGNAAAAARPALGFTFGATTRADIARAVARGGGACVDRRAELECTNVAVDAGPPLETGWFRFDPRGGLDSIRAVRRAPVVAISETFVQLARDLATRAGAPAMRTGSSDPADLARGALRQAAVEYRFTNYRAVLRATNVGTGYALTEEYANLVD